MTQYSVRHTQDTSGKRQNDRRILHLARFACILLLLIAAAFRFYALPDLPLGLGEHRARDGERRVGGGAALLVAEHAGLTRAVVLALLDALGLVAERVDGVAEHRIGARHRGDDRDQREEEGEGARLHSKSASTPKVP